MVNTVCRWYRINGRILGSKLEEWKKTLKDKGLKISRSKTEYIEYNFGGSKCGANGESQVMKSSVNEVGDFKRLKYLRPVQQIDDDFKEEYRWI